jgi:short-subunit dehydrogenase
VNDKQILITGATNGIGLAAAEALAARGANLAIVGRSKTRTRIASARIRTAAGRGDGGDIHRRPLVAGLGAQIGR